LEESLKLADVPVPSSRIEAMQAITIMANITAYSTAVGPSSLIRKLIIKRFMMLNLPNKFEGKSLVRDQAKDESTAEKIR
jgi:hypothetical protein